MSESPMRLHFLWLLLFFCVPPSSFFIVDAYVFRFAVCRPHQIQALTEFKNEFDTRGCNHNDSFNGVLCDKSTGAVAMLQLRACLSGILRPNSSLFGFHQLRYLNLIENSLIFSALPSEFGNLNRLEVLSLSSNGFFGQVPSSFNNLSVLSYLDLSHNELTGSFPLVRNLTKLSSLELSDNHFFGPLNPNSSLFELHQLRYLSLSFNNFSSSFASEFGNLNQLETLSLSSNDFFGRVPPTISNLTWLTNLLLNQNKLTGSFPPVKNLTKLSLLEFHDNHFYGTVPSSLFTLPYLSYLDVRENYFNGSIEVLNSSASSRLEFMYMGNNHFEGKILEPISKLINLKHLDLSFLNISYPIKLNLLSSLKSLMFLDISGNSISPSSLSSESNMPLTLGTLILGKCGITEFPNIIKTLQNLEIIDISDNRIDGKMPEWLWSLPRLSTMHIQNNSFNGFEGSANITVTSSVQNLDLSSNCFEGVLPNLPLFISVFSAARNSFTGEIPLSICNITSFVVLDLSYNNFSGAVPQCMSNFTFVNLRKNNLDGSIPDSFYAGASLQTLDVGYNRLSRKLPRSFLNCSSLRFLSVENNEIKDTFPFWLKTLPNLQVFILRSNKFFGPISLPHQGPLGFPELRILEISDNKFTGSLPPNYFVNWKASSPTMNEDGSVSKEEGNKLNSNGKRVGPQESKREDKGPEIKKPTPTSSSPTKVEDKVEKKTATTRPLLTAVFLVSTPAITKTVDAKQSPG